MSVARIARIARIARYTTCALAVLLPFAMLPCPPTAWAAGKPFLGKLHTIDTLASTVPMNGDVNPYGVAVVPRTVGTLVKDNIRSLPGPCRRRFRFRAAFQRQQTIAADDPRFKKFSDLVEDTYQAFLSVPIISGGDVIGVINVHHRDPHEHTPGEVALATFVGEQMGGAIEKARLKDENERLLEETQDMKRQLETRKLVERAKGILQRRLQLTEEDAYLRLRNESRRLRRPMKDLAEAVILSEDLNRKNELGGEI